MNEPQLRYRVSKLGGYLLAGFAVIADLVQFIFALTVALSPLNILITIIVDGAVFFYFLICGVPFLKGKRATGRLGAVLISAVVELVPILDALPMLTLNVLFSIHSSRKEDKEAFDAAHEKWMAAEGQRQKEMAYAQAVYRREVEKAKAQFNAQREAESRDLDEA